MVFQRFYFYRVTGYAEVRIDGLHDTGGVAAHAGVVGYYHMQLHTRAWDVDNLERVANIKEMTGNKGIYNSARIPPPTDFKSAREMRFASVPQGSGLAPFRGQLTNAGKEPSVLNLTLNNAFDWPVEFMGEGEATCYSTPSGSQPAPEEGAEVNLRVHTDSEVRFGQGGFLIHSDLAGRPQERGHRAARDPPAKQGRCDSVVPARAICYIVAVRAPPSRRLIRGSKASGLWS